MCIGFFIAAGSAFTGPGASAFPEAVRDSGILSLPELIIVLLMFLWLWKTLRPSQRVVGALAGLLVRAAASHRIRFDHIGLDNCRPHCMSIFAKMMEESMLSVVWCWSIPGVQRSLHK